MAQARRALRARAATREGEREACGVSVWARPGWLCARRRGAWLTRSSAESLEPAAAGYDLGNRVSGAGSARSGAAG